jgi:hypothetical protein
MPFTLLASTLQVRNTSLERSFLDRRVLGVILLALPLCMPASARVLAEEIQFIISVSDAQGRPVTDLAREDIQMSENGVMQEVTRIRPYRAPVKLTIAVDNGPLSRDALAHYRAGLTGLVKALPGDVEVTLITTAPQPLMVVQPTTDRQRILRGVTGFAPEQESPRFTDALVEFSQRLEQELKKSGRLDFVPVLVMVSTTAIEAVSYEVPAISRALGFLKWRKAKVFVTMTSSKPEVAGMAQLNTSRQTLIAIPATELTRGRYEALAISNRLATLLPEFGEEIAALHRKHANQMLVTVQRQDGLTGPLQRPRVEVMRPGLTGLVSLDGLP